MPFARDPLSVRYDGPVRNVMLRAIRASRDGRSVRAYVASSRAEHRSPDEGGRTRHERAFTRAAYYLVWRAPINAGRIPDWSLHLTWGDDLAPSGSNLARPVFVRIYPRRGPRGGREHGYAIPAARSWTKNDAVRSGGLGSGRERFY